ncbi:MAG: GNAT family N-acetyltransferase [Clostridia bacterium]|nr:GNAT family N-acetyltransferase [Clostridia bacterium]
MLYRIAAPEEIPTLIELRRVQLIEESVNEEGRRAEEFDAIDISEQMADFFTRKMADGSMVEWVAEEDGEIIATSAVLFYEFPPSLDYPNGMKAYIANMYTKPAFRGRGIATALIGKLVEEAERRGVTRLWLSASNKGKPVYLNSSFVVADWLMERYL